MSVLSVLAYLAFMVLMAYVWSRRRAVVVAGFFLIFPLVYRATDILYLDLAGPLYAREVGRYVGGNFAAPIFIYSACALILPLLWTFPDRSPAVLSRYVESRRAQGLYHTVAANGAFAVLLLLLGALVTNMVLVGTIPLVQGIDRLEYNLSAGRLHTGAYELTFLFAFTMGAFTVLPRLNGGAYDLRFALLNAALLFYWVLTGNRFSIFFSQLSYFFMPVAAVMLLARVRLIPARAPGSPLQRLLSSRLVSTVVGVLAVALIAGLVLNSYFNVRSYREPLREIEERVLVQPVQLWATAWDRVEFAKPRPLVDDYALEEIVINPIDPTRNTTIQFLITREVGYFRSQELVELGQQYNGGYPEVHFELFNPWLALLTLPFVGLVTALFLRFCIILLVRNMVVSSIAGVYLFFGLSLHYAGGSVTFFMAATYWLKIAAFLGALLVETQLRKGPGATRPKSGGGALSGFFPAPIESARSASASLLANSGRSRGPASFGRDPLPHRPG